MRALIQRVSEAAVRVEGEVVGQCGPGLLVLICAMQNDGPDQAKAMAAKIAKLRIFADAAGKMNLSLRDIQGSALVVSQFTLAGDASRGNRPSFASAARPELGKALYEDFVAALRAEGVPCQTGIFAADMKVSLVNDGPVTLWLDSDL